MNELEILRLTYPRVSEIISKQNSAEMRGISLEILANAALRGIAVHNHCIAFVKGLWSAEIEEEYKPYVEAFTDWYSNNVGECLFAGIRLYDDSKRFTGEYDLIVRLKETNQVVLVDIKATAAISKTWPVQLAAYNHLCEVNSYPKIDAFYNVHLKKMKSPVYEKKGEEKVLVSPPKVKAVAVEHKDITRYWNIFSSALSCYDFFDRKEF